jgi:hypothetical protein
LQRLKNAPINRIERDWAAHLEYCAAFLRRLTEVDLNLQKYCARTNLQSLVR